MLLPEIWHREELHTHTQTDNNSAGVSERGVCVTDVHDGLKDAVHHDILQQHVLTDVVRGCQHDQQKTKTQVLETGCSTGVRRRGKETGRGEKNRFTKECVMR